MFLTAAVEGKLSASPPALSLFLAAAFEGRPVNEAAAHCLAACEVVVGAYSDVFNCCTFNSDTLQCAVSVGPLYQASSLRPRNRARIVAPVQLCPATPKPTPAPTAPTPAPTAPTPSPTEPRSVLSHRCLSALLHHVGKINTHF